MQKIRFDSHHILGHIVAIIAIIAFVAQIVCVVHYPINFTQAFFLLSFGLITVILLLIRNLSFTTMFLLSTLTMITAWRLSALAGYNVIAYIYLFAMTLKLIMYIDCCYTNVVLAKKNTALIEHRVTVYEWQLLFIRLFIGFDTIPHFAEKLFAGPIVRMADIQAFTQIGVPNPTAFVILAGFVELGGAIAISCGLLTRLGCICFASYLLVATYLGHHFLNGFIWANNGGGWEYPVVWTTIVLSFAVFGAGDFSLDRVLKDNYRIPTWIRHLMGGRHS